MNEDAGTPKTYDPVTQDATRPRPGAKTTAVSPVDEYIADLLAEVGEPTPAEIARAEMIVQRIVAHARPSPRSATR